MKSKNSTLRPQHGLTLIELMVTVSIIAIIAAVAFPAYERQSLKSKRSDGMAMLMEVQSKQERFIIDNSQYASTLTALDSSYGSPLMSAKGYYEITVTTANNNQSYTLTATPQGGQTDDECGKLYLDNLGNRTWSQTSIAKCW